MIKDGIVLIYKPTMISSNDLDYKVRRVFDTKKVGHLGTLDPFAEGLMVLGVNEGTKILPYLDSETKSYKATLKLGVETDTLDHTGKVINEVYVNEFLTEEDVKDALNSFLGEYDQLPPKYSSKSIAGFRAYELARMNIDFELKTKRVSVFEINLIKFDKLNNEITFSVKVSKGNYIRSLGLDIAKKLNTVGHLTYLKRTSIGEFILTDETKTIETLQREDLISLKNVLHEVPKIDLTEEEFKMYKYGNPNKYPYCGDNIMFFYHDDPLFLLEYKHEKQLYYVKRGFNYEYYKDK